MENKKKKKKGGNAWLPILISVGIGVIIGLFAIRYTDAAKADGENVLLQYAIIFGMLFAAIYIQTVIHEAGRLVFGLLSGYRFSSFRIFSFLLKKEQGKFCIKRLKLAGTAGQCLMAPPDMVNGKMPVMFYNLGGALLNVIFALLFLGIYFLVADIPYVSLFFFVLFISGLMFAAINGIPMRMGLVDNDGYNAFSLSKNPDAMRAMWIQLKISDEQIKGKRLKDMPQEWFTLPDEEKMSDSLVATIAVLAANRMMDEGNLGDADLLMEKLLSMESGIVGLHRSLMICDRMCCEMLGMCRVQVLEAMYTDSQKKFMKSMERLPSVIRTEYICALLCEKNLPKAQKIKKRFEKAAKDYPYPADIVAERELLGLADEKAKNEVKL